MPQEQIHELARRIEELQLRNQVLELALKRLMLTVARQDELVVRTFLQDVGKLATKMEQESAATNGPDSVDLKHCARFIRDVARNLSPR